jgi:hypothetical protein
MNPPAVAAMWRAFPRAACALFAAWMLAACTGVGLERVTGQAGEPVSAAELDPPRGERVATGEDGPPGTLEQARGQCWMRLERDKSAPRDLEKRAALVERCAAERMRGR